MRKNVFETILGAIVLVVAGLFLFLAYTTSSVKAVSGYPLEARFSSVSGLTAGADVRISGVKIGTVTHQYLDKATYQAVVRMEIDNSVKLPRDTSASIASESLLGGRYLQLEPGGDEEILKPGGLIEYTQSAVNLEELLGRFIFSSANNASKSKDGASDAATPQATGKP
jgi:phospholipid/cholesterol/gamma-HCH transport system substrate-binding protein